MFSFEKWEGSGNDFILLTNASSIKLNKETVSHLCHRRYGIGADGILLIEEHPSFRFTIYNADGSRAHMCGNGLRCVAAYLLEKHRMESVAVESADMKHHCFLQKELIGTTIRFANEIVPLGELVPQSQGVFWADTGVPHVIVLVEEIPVDWLLQAKALRKHPKLGAAGANVSFVNLHSHAIRTFERGVEGETYSCGTAAVATACVLYSFDCRKDFHLRYPHDALNVSLEIDSERIKTAILYGKASRVFSGEMHSSKKALCLLDAMVVEQAGKRRLQT